MRPIVWGFILMMVGGVFWVMFSVLAAFEELADEAGILIALSLRHVILL
ncbi:hypothetical protein KEJ50_05810 [Candidatus Bathyarchaeota archaeon]|nr:hypothetical protein [Candidatus Bathyarchaeota archaeon]